MLISPFCRRWGDGVAYKCVAVLAGVLGKLCGTVAFRNLKTEDC
jgi:hypothetical protein